MATNDFKPFGVGPDNDNISQATYLASTFLVKGFVGGILRHENLNKVLRQATVPGSAIMQVLSTLLDEDFVDADDQTVLLDQITRALSAALPYDPLGFYDASAIGSWITAYAHDLIPTPNQVLISADVDGNLVFSTPQNLHSAADPTFRDMTVRRLAGGTAPTIAGYGAGAGTSPSGSISKGTELAFQFDLTSGSGTPATASVIAAFTFATPFATGHVPLIQLSPNNARTSGLQGSGTTACSISGASETGFNLISNGTTGLSASQSYSWIIRVQGF